MTDAERVLHALLHDLRTPLGAAQGYLRLIQEGQLKTAADQERALTRSLKALGDAARLCQSAGDFLDSSSGSGVTRIGAEAFAKQVEGAARAKGLAVAPLEKDPDAPANSTLALTGNVGSLCDAIVFVLSTSARGSARNGTTMHTRAGAHDLMFMARGAGEPPRGGSPATAPDDRLWAVGLPLAVACRRIVKSSGQILSFDSNDGLIVAFPVEQHPI
jgi:hypothetical protein